MTDADAQTIRACVLRAITRNRVAGFDFPGYFLDIEWEKIPDATADMNIADGPHCRNPDGSINIAALGVLTSHALAATGRAQMPAGSRLALLRLQMQMTGAEARGRISAAARLLGFTTGATLRQSQSALTLSAQGVAICHASGEFAALPPPPNVQLAPLPWQQAATQPTPLSASELQSDERALLKISDKAASAATSGTSFIQNFWNGNPQRTAYGAKNRIVTGPHLANRVGQAQGGVLFGIACATASAAAPAGMMLAGASAWYISPGQGKALTVKSRIIHGGRTFALVRTEINAARRERVVLAITQHVARAL